MIKRISFAVLLAGLFLAAMATTAGTSLEITNKIGQLDCGDGKGKKDA